MKLYWESIETTETPTLLKNDIPVLVDLDTWENAVRGILRLWAQGYAGWNWDGWNIHNNWINAHLTSNERAALFEIMEDSNGT